VPGRGCTQGTVLSLPNPQSYLNLSSASQLFMYLFIRTVLSLSNSPQPSFKLALASGIVPNLLLLLSSSESMNLFFTCSQTLNYSSNSSYLVLSLSKSLQPPLTLLSASKIVLNLFLPCPQPLFTLSPGSKSPVSLLTLSSPS
jgi:hypothetical protein